MVLHEPPFSPDDEHRRRGAREYAASLTALLAEGRTGDALVLFMTLTGMPAAVAEQMREQPWWAGLEANAPTLAYDSAVMGDLTRDGTIPFEQAAAVAVPALVLCGGASPAWMIDVGRQVARAIPHGRHQILPGQEHVVPPEILVPALTDFLAS